MADTANIVVAIELQDYRNTIVRVSLVSDGSGLTNYVLVDPTSAASGQVNLSVSQAGQTFYPGTNLKITALDYDVQGMGVRLTWKATTNQDIAALGNAPQQFEWETFGGLRVPAALAGATGQILLSTVGAAANATLFVLLYLRNNVPQS